MCDLGFTLAALSCPREKRAMLGWGLKKANYVYAHMMKRLDEAIFYLLFYLVFFIYPLSRNSVLCCQITVKLLGKLQSSNKHLVVYADLCPKVHLKLELLRLSKTQCSYCFLFPACNPGTFKSKQGDGFCVPCPANSRTSSGASTVCSCRTGYYRSDTDPPDSACTSKYGFF